jgi:hypothetical protein
VRGAAHGAVAPGARRERLARERTAAMLRREARLTAELADQLEPLLGPAGRPTGGAAMSAWRRRHVDAYLALPPWTRAWRTWVSWARLQRAAAVVALTGLWTLVCLPLQLLGLAGVGASQAGVAALLALAPVAALAPPAPRGRFATPLPRAAERWRGSRAARRVPGAVAVAGACLVAAVAALALAGGGGPTGLDSPAPALEAEAVREAVAATCGVSAGVEVELRRPGRYEALLPGGGSVTVGMLRGRVDRPDGRNARVAGGAAACPGP